MYQLPGGLIIQFAQNCLALQQLTGNASLFPLPSLPCSMKHNFFILLLPPPSPFSTLPLNRCGECQGPCPPHFTICSQFLLLLNYFSHILPLIAVFYSFYMDPNLKYMCFDLVP